MKSKIATLLSLPAMATVNPMPGTILPQYLMSSAGTLLEGFEDHTTFSLSGAGAVKANNTSEYKQGTQSVKVTSPTGSTIGRITKTGLSWDFSAVDDFYFWFYLHDANCASVQIQLGQGGFTNGKSNTTYRHTFQPGWNLVRLLKADFTTNGTGDWSTTFDQFRINTTASAGTVTEVSYDALYVGATRTPAIIITFDDSDPSVYTEGYSYMQPLGIPGTFYVISDDIDGSSLITTAQLNAMYAAGWDIANHTTTGASLSGESQATCETRLGDCKTALDAAGWTRASSHVAYPGGFCDATVLAAMAAQSMTSGRNIEVARYPVMPQDDWHQLQLGKQFGNTLSLAQATAWIDTLLARDEIGIALFHKLVTTPTLTTEWAIADFQDFIDYIVTNNLQCLTINQMYRLQSGSITV